MKKLLLSLALLVIVASVSAQVNMLSPYSLTSDTVSNTGTAFLTVRNAGTKQETTVQVVCTEISGTTGGTISLLGSIDGTNFVALQAEESSTAIPTKTALDVASQTFIFRVKGNPCTHYRVSWTGTGTMSASFTAKLMSH